MESCIIGSLFLMFPLKQNIIDNPCKFRNVETLFFLNIYIYIYTHTHTHTHTHIYIYIYIHTHIYMYAAAKSLQSCPTLCDPIDGSPPGSPVPGILQARTLEWVAISFSNSWKIKSESEVTQLCLTLSDPMDCSLPCSSIHGIFQARVPEWGDIAFSRYICI